MAIQVPDRDTLTAQVLANLKSRRPTLDTSRGSVPWMIVAAFVEAHYGVFYNLASAEKGIMPHADMDTATLEEHADLRLGPDARRPAQKASGTNALRVTGTDASAAVTAGLKLQGTDGLRYQLTSGGTVGSGTLDVSVESLTGGIASNKLTGDVLTFESPPTHIEAEATLVGDLTGGIDQETDPELLDRVIHAYLNPPAGGRLSDYWAWSMKVAGVARAYVYGPSKVAPLGRRGPGIVDMAIATAGSGSARIPSGLLLQQVTDAIEDSRPAAPKEFGVLAPSTVAQDIDVKVAQSYGYEWDWTASGNEEVQSWDGDTKTLTWVNALPETLTARIESVGSARIYVAGQMLTCTAYSTGSKTTTVSETPATAPSSGDPIYPAGPLSQPCKGAIQAHVDTLGPARGQAADPNQRWEDSLKIAKLEAVLVYRRLSSGAVSGVQGCDNADVIIPSTDVAPADSPPSPPQLLVAGKITVRPL